MRGERGVEEGRRPAARHARRPWVGRAAAVPAAIVLGLVLMRPALAQEREMPSPEERVERLKAELQLTDEQAAKLREIFAAQRAKMRELMQAEALDREARRQRMMQIRGETREAIRKVLTEEQFKRYEELARRRMRERARGRPGGPPGR
jgi:protein CpxP